MSNLDSHPRFCEDCGEQESDDVYVRPRADLPEDSYSYAVLCDTCYAGVIKFSDMGGMSDATGFVASNIDDDFDFWRKY